MYFHFRNGRPQSPMDGSHGHVPGQVGESEAGLSGHLGQAIQTGVHRRSHRLRVVAVDDGVIRVLDDPDVLQVLRLLLLEGLIPRWQHS